MDAVTYPCWDESYSMLAKQASENTRGCSAVIDADKTIGITTVIDMCID